MRKTTCQILFLLLPGFLVAQVFFDVDQSVKLTAEVSTAPPTITVNWIQDPRTLSYDLYRREYQDSTWGEKISSYPAGTTQYVDTDVRPHALYEYKVVKYVEGVEGYGYVLSSIERPAVHHSGELLLVLTSGTQSQIEPDVNEYLALVETDGWQARTLIIDDNANVSDVKAAIIAAHSSSPFSAVLLLGDVPVPHSGDIKPDAHPTHRGAWSADIYYGDLDGTWTDTEVTITQAENTINHNVPGDGKWDQSFLPSDVEVAVGRVDFSNMPVFNQDEYQLLREYLQKDIAYRTKRITINQRAAMRNTNPWRGALGQNGIRNFSPLVGPENITYDEWEDVFNDTYLWFYGAGGGSQTAAGNLGSSFVYARSDFKAVFTGWFGSYFGDYDFEDNYMRAVIGSGTTLSAVWAGAPHWHFHSMGIGYPLAHATTTTQNNDTIYTADFFPRGVHVNLLGDPTLKSYIVAPPTDLALAEQGDVIHLTWSPSGEEIDQYYIYLRMASEEVYALIDSTTSTDFQASSQGAEVAHQYLVRAGKLTTTPSGSFTNLSSGAAATITTLTSLPGFDLGEIGVFPNPASGEVAIRTAKDVLSVALLSTAGQTIARLHPPGDRREVQLSLVGVPAGAYLLRVAFRDGVVYRKLVVVE
ncbi:hypothetical protein [Neolewinella persica]|uniref:hypothetical protein n=1 Tax=Neolewinella persica TaxID=70998 RepID=UPI00036B31CA|nr:hypothetical protein [Neolewinella persica]